MRTSPDCLPCFRRQVDYVAELSGASPELKKKMHGEAEKLLRRFDLHRSPPENAMAIYSMLSQLASKRDPFSLIKEESNQAALALLPRLQRLVAEADDQLRAAARLSIAGNVIDYGAQQNFDVDRAISDCLSRPPAVDHFDRLRQKLSRAEKILYLADNCGELVFDGIFIGQLGKQVTLAVKSQPIINDALPEDAKACGLDRICRIIENGTGCPGTPLPSCSDQFRKEFHSADLIISKGQGNFETLSETAAPIFFLLLVKCPVVAEHAAEIAGLPSASVKTGDQLIIEGNYR